MLSSPRKRKNSNNSKKMNCWMVRFFIVVAIVGLAIRSLNKAAKITAYYYSDAKNESMIGVPQQQQQQQQQLSSTTTTKAKKKKETYFNAASQLLANSLRNVFQGGESKSNRDGTSIQQQQQQQQQEQFDSSFDGESSSSNSNSNLLKLVIAKTISIKDVNTTITDIQTITDKYATKQHSNANNNNNEILHFEIQWKVFCYQQESYNAILDHLTMEQWKEQYNVVVHLELDRNKIYFWNHYLRPNVLQDDDIDYVWMMDGDIQIQYMSWICFWKIVQDFQPLIFAPALMSSRNTKEDKAWENRKVYVGSTHPQHCHVKQQQQHNTLSVPVPANDFQKLIAMDVWVIESQLPIFSKRAWDVVYQQFDEYVPGWGNFQSMWAPDLFWCKLVNHHLLQQININDNTTSTETSRPAMRWGFAKNFCSLNPNITEYYHEEEEEEPYPANNNNNNNNGIGTTSTSSSSRNRYYYDATLETNLQHACMIIHATPVQDLDSRTIKVYQNEQQSIQFHEEAKQDLLRYKEGLSSFYSGKIMAKTVLYKAYLSSQKSSSVQNQCQPCKHKGCLPQTTSR
eukprot:scaffold26742_cov122-Cylindrotheca_fusiformis.AAC.2